MVDLEEIRQMIIDCKNRKSKMSDWEYKFIFSLNENIKELSYKQIERIEEIWDKVT